MIERTANCVSLATPAMDNANCPYCMAPVGYESMRLWDGRCYCRKCIDEVCPALAAAMHEGKPLTDVLTPEHVNGRHFLHWVGKTYLCMILIFFGLPLSLVTIRANASPLGLFLVLGFFGGFGMIFLSIIAAISTPAIRSKLPRIVSIEPGVLRIRMNHDEILASLVDCEWYVGSTQYDGLCMFTTLRRGVILQTPDAQIACGFGPCSLELWQGFLTVARVEYNRRLSLISILLSALLGLVLGGFSGYCIGQAAASFTNNADWTFIIAFLGAFDGIGIALLFSMATSEGLLAAQKRLHPLAIGLGFLAIAVQIVFHQGALATLIVGCCNFIVGLCTGLLCRQRIKRIQIDRELRRPVAAAK